MTDPIDISVATYNVLSQSYVRKDRYPASPPRSLDPDYRHPLLLERIEKLNADLLCLQELDASVYATLEARLQATHHSAYAERRGRGEGSAIFARRSILRWSPLRELHYDAHRPGHDDLALIATLELQGQPLEVAVTHLTWQPDETPTAEHLGRRQLLELLEHRDQTSPKAIWLFAGDFNALPQSVVLKTALERGMAESCLAQRPWDTCAINGRPRKIDYLLYSAGRLSPKPGVLPRLYRDSVLPSLTEPSDHLPLQVDFTLANV
jgi:mRNA deadenylase 3'-5' endonuclease subunit Ccr4